MGGQAPKDVKISLPRFSRALRVIGLHVGLAVGNDTSNSLDFSFRIDRTVRTLEDNAIQLKLLVKLV